MGIIFEGIITALLIFIAFCVVLGTMLLIKGFIDNLWRKERFVCNNCKHVNLVNENQRGIECNNCGAYFLRQKTVRE